MRLTGADVVAMSLSVPFPSIPQAVLKASSLLSLTFPWVLRRMSIDALDLCKVLESFARFCPGLPVSELSERQRRQQR